MNTLLPMESLSFLIKTSYYMLHSLTINFYNKLVSTKYLLTSSFQHESFSFN